MSGVPRPGVGQEDASRNEWPDARAVPDGALGAVGGATPGAAPGAGLADCRARLTAWVSGRVQGVGFRWWVRSIALELELVGVAENMVDGRVKVVAEGDRAQCEVMLARLEGPGSPGRVAQVTHRWDEVRGGLSGFAER